MGGLLAVIVMNLQELKVEVVNAIKKAATTVPEYVEGKLKKAYEAEEGVAKNQIKNILENIKIAKENCVPLCQDTGIVTFHVSIKDLKIDLTSLEKVLREAVKEATSAVPLRPNAVDPLTRVNSGNNVGEGVPVIYYSSGERDEIVIHLRGAGSDNQTFLKIFPPTINKEEVERFIINCTLENAEKACPPLIIGVGIGGTSDYSLILSKKALLDSSDMDDWERELLRKVNSLGVGPMGLGGKTTALRLKIKKAYCHTASLPVAVSFNCWALRTAKISLERFL